jgi:hypothetical protein
VLKKTKTELLERKVKKLEAERQLKIRAIKYVYAINTKMQQLVKSRIEAINPHQEKEQIAAELDIMKVNFRTNVFVNANLSIPIPAHKVQPTVF